MAITANNTTVSFHDGETICTLHSTVIARLKNGTVTLNSGGWLTVTTKKRMNEFLREYDIPASVYQKRGTWYLQRQGLDDTPYADGMSFEV